MSKPIDGKKLLDDTKQKVKQNNQKETNMKKSIIITVAITLVTVAAFGLTFWAGTAYNQALNDRIKDEAKSLSAIVVEQPKK